jgi:alcohol dehydrogenase class IV
MIQPSLYTQPKIPAPLILSIDSVPDHRTALPRIWKSSDTNRHLDRLGVGSVFLVADDRAYACSGAETMLRRALRDRQVVRFTDFTANPKSHEIEQAVQAFRGGQFDLIIAVGGGSAIDVAKLARACDQPGASAVDVIEKRATIVPKGVPLLAIPTTAGTGAEATHFSAVYVDGRKHSLADQSMRPEFVILNEKLLASLPPEIMLQSGLDATCQAIESMWSIRSTAESRSVAARALKLAWRALPRCLAEPTDRSRSMMLQASHLAGRAIDTSQTTACHALSYSLTSHFHLPHGRAVALMLAPVWSFNAAVSEENIADPRGVPYVQSIMQRIAAIIGAENVGHASALIKNRLSQLGAAISFSSCNIPADRAIDIIASEVDPHRAGNNPRRVGPGDVRDILLALGD